MFIVPKPKESQSRRDGIFLGTKTKKNRSPVGTSSKIGCRRQPLAQCRSYGTRHVFGAAFAINMPLLAELAQMSTNACGLPRLGY